MTGSKRFATTIAIRSPADADAVAAFVRWAWYASRRAGLHLDGATDEFATPEILLATLRTVAPSLYVRDEEIEAVAARMSMERWAAGEVVQHDGEIPDALRIVVRGRVAVYLRSTLGDLRLIGKLAPGELLGITALVRQPSFSTARAIDRLRRPPGLRPVSAHPDPRAAHQQPAVVCVIGEDEAGNHGRPQQFDVP